MTAFLWAIVVLMSAALLAQIFALVGMLLTAKRAARRISEIKSQISDRMHASTVLMKEMRLTIQPRLTTIRQNGKEVKALAKSRWQSTQVALSDANRRAQRITLRLNDGVQTVGQQGQRIYQDVIEPIQSASQVIRGLKAVLWLFREVA